jgi:hypothetical protein
MILGMECLERFSPMKIHWAHKLLTIPYQNNTITLQGFVQGSLDCAMVELMQLSSETSKPSTKGTPYVIQQVLQQFQSVSAYPSELPQGDLVIIQFQ